MLTEDTERDMAMAGYKIVLTRVNFFEYSFAGCDAVGKRIVAKALTYANPSPFAYSDQIQMFDRRDMTFKVGMLPTLIKKLSSAGREYRLVDYDFKLPRSVKIDERLGGKYIHQRRAVEAFFRRRIGIIVVPTRGGKTFIAGECIRIFLQTEAVSYKALFIVDSKTLFQQAIDDFKRYFEPYGGIEIGEIRAGRIDTEKRVTVAMIQTIQATLSKRCTETGKKNKLKTFLRGLRFLIVDEVHDNASSPKLKIYKSCKSLTHQLSLSATPYRAEAFVENLRLKAWSGDVVYRIKEETLRERGVLTEYKVFLLALEQDSRALRACTYAAYQKAIIFNSQIRDAVVVKVIETCRANGFKTLVMFQSIDHGRHIAELTGCTFIHGNTDNETRDRVKEEFLARPDGGVLMASNIFKKGVTLPEVEVLFNVDGGLENANTIQRKGRVLGATEAKSRSAIIDFIDIDDAYFSEHSSTRLNTYVKAVGEAGIGILDTAVENWLTTLERWLKIWLSVNRHSTDTPSEF